MTPLGWKYALLVWGYALVWFFVNDMAKVEVHRLLNLERNATSATWQERMPVFIRQSSRRQVRQIKGALSLKLSEGNSSA